MNNPKTLKDRLICIMTDGEYRSSFELQKSLRMRYDAIHSDSAITAAIRFIDNDQIHYRKYRKEKVWIKDQLYKYRIVVAQK